MNLKDTVAGMISDDYKARFKAEYQQVMIRKEKLQTMIGEWINGDLSFDPVCQAEILLDQLTVMEKYLTILELRAKVEGIAL